MYLLDHGTVEIHLPCRYTGRRRMPWRTSIARRLRAWGTFIEEYRA